MAVRLLLRSFLGVHGGDQLLVGHVVRQLPGFHQDILQEKEAVFLEDQIVFPGLLVMVAGDDGCDGGEVCLRN